MISQKDEMAAIHRAQQAIDTPYPTYIDDQYVLPAFGSWGEVRAKFNSTRKERARRVAALAFWYLTGNEVQLPIYEGTAQRILRALLTEHLVRVGDPDVKLSKKAIKAVREAQLFQTSLRVNKYSFYTENAYSYEGAVANAVMLRKKYRTHYTPRIWAIDRRGERVRCNDVLAIAAGLMKKGEP